MLVFLANALPYILAISIAIGATLALRQGYTRQLSTTQDRLIAAQEKERQALGSEIEGLKRDITRHKRILATVALALKRRGLIITYDTDDIITLYDTQAHTTTTTESVNPVPLALPEEE